MFLSVATPPDATCRRAWAGFGALNRAKYAIYLEAAGGDAMLLHGDAPGGNALGDIIASILHALNRETLLFAAAGLAIGGLDDLAVDLLYISRTIWRRMTVYTRHDRMTAGSLPPPQHPGRLAVFVPAWREADVIAPMLRHALTLWGSADYRIFVGVYPNDPETLAALAPVAQGDGRIVVAINDRPGPTTKADCLNLLWRTMTTYERDSGVGMKAVILHDAEDVVHRDEIRLFDFMIDRFHLVQLPVLPLAGQGGWLRRAIANHNRVLAQIRRKLAIGWENRPVCSQMLTV